MFTFLLGHLSRRRPQPVAMAQDPWGNDNDGNKKNDQPPDLDELFNKLLRRNPRRNNGNNNQNKPFFHVFPLQSLNLAKKQKT